jgi:beta-fructofuranosidase
MSPQIMKRLWPAILTGFLSVAPGVTALSAPTTLVECGKFVKIYDPGVNENQHWYINDHCFIQDTNGQWHLFGITHPEPAGPDQEVLFAHATAKTLLQQPWQKLPPALEVATNAPWNETHLWAPDVVYHDHLYYMYYSAGGTDRAKTKIHLATSPDLTTWTRSPKNPMVVDGYDTRDPFILRWKDKWVMYYTATSEPARGHHVVAYVTSDDLVTWTNRGFAFVDPSVGSVGGPTESPFVVQRGDSFYLFIGPRGGYNGTDVFVSPDPFHWDNTALVGHFPAHAAEIVRDTDGQWYISRAGWGQGGVYLAPLIWKDNQ